MKVELTYPVHGSSQLWYLAPSKMEIGKKCRMSGNFVMFSLHSGDALIVKPDGVDLDKWTPLPPGTVISFTQP